MTPEHARRRRRLAATAAFAAFWAALLVTIGFPLLPVAGLYLLFAVGLAAAVEGRELVDAVSRRAREVDLTPLGAARSRAAELVERLRRDAAAARARRTARGEAHRLNALAASLRHAGELDAALDAGEKALELVRVLGDRRAEALTLNGIGLTQARLGDEAGAVDSYETAVAILTDLGDSHGAGRVLANLGALHLDLGHADEARVRWLDALERLEPGSPEHERTAEQLRLAS
jgi:tetratricopeptide (TPR) repeat protein